ncbi:hypothetical protein K0M31_013074, partial [Melipona bicolor]
FIWTCIIICHELLGVPTGQSGAAHLRGVALTNASYEESALESVFDQTGPRTCTVQTGRQTLSTNATIKDFDQGTLSDEKFIRHA